MRCFLAIILLLVSVFLSAGTSHAQTVARVSTVLTFGNTGAVEAVSKEQLSGTLSPTDVAKTRSLPKIPGTPIYSQSGGVIRTGADAATSLVLGEMGSARMGSDSEVRVPDPAEGHSLEMLKGQLFLNVSGEELKKRGNTEFKLKTPAALLAVKGTRFFSTTAEATGSAPTTDTIGVHEGSVTVDEPVSGKSLTLTAGQAVSVTSGSLGEVRSLTDEEKSRSTNYDIAQLTRTSLALIARVKGQRTARIFLDGKISTTTVSGTNGGNTAVVIPKDFERYLEWEPMKEEGAQFALSEPELSEDGTLRYLWTPPHRSSGKRYMVRTHSQSKWSLPQSISQTHKPVAVMFRIRTKSVALATLSLNPGNFSYFQRKVTDIQLSDPSDGTWYARIQPWPEPSKSPYPVRGFSFSAILAPVVHEPKSTLISQEEAAIELADFVLLSAPK